MAENKSKRVRRDRREEIIQKATELFAEYGFEGTALSQVSAAVGLTDAGVLHYFPSKAHLLQGVLEYREQKEIEKFTPHIIAEKSSPEELFKLLEEVVEDGEKTPGLVQLFTVLVSESIRSDHPSHEFFVQRYRQGREMYTRQFFTLLKPSIREDVNLDELSALIMAVMDGLQIQWLLDPGKVNMVEAFRLFSKIVANYLEN